MAWTSPRTWTTGELVTAAIMNTHVRDNLNALFSPPSDSSTLTTNISTTNTSFENATGLTATLTTAGDTVLIGFIGTLDHTVASATIELDIDIDATREGGTDGIISVETEKESNASFTWRATGLSAAAHTFQLQWKTTEATATLRATNRVVMFWAAEIS